MIAIYANQQIYSQLPGSDKIVVEFKQFVRDGWLSAGVC